MTTRWLPDKQGHPRYSAGEDTFAGRAEEKFLHKAPKTEVIAEDLSGPKPNIVLIRTTSLKIF